MNIPNFLSNSLKSALVSLGVDPPANRPVDVTTTADIRFGDFQSNLAMQFAKQLGKNPREFAGEIIEKLDLSEQLKVEVTGPGFISFTLLPGTWAGQVREQWASKDLGIPKTDEAKTIVIDFSAPNVAKPMHIGHIRSTIIGECLSRVARALGHTVIKDNHLGDWGTQFGMVIWAWKRDLNREQLSESPLAELLRLYRMANDAKKADESVAGEYRMELVKLQQGDEENLAIWNQCVELSRKGLDEIYDRLDVSFDHWLGESFYNEELPLVVQKLEEMNLACESDGAITALSGGCLEPQKDPFKIFRDKEWRDFPMIVRKDDGAFNYATTDIATVNHRVNEWNADEIWYVVDTRQGGHFAQLFDLVRRLGFNEVRLEHIAFGTILGKDGSPLKTRSGDLPQLDDVLDSAVEAAGKVVSERSRLEKEEERDELAKLIGINSVKFTELSHQRLSDYTFDLEKMVALEGDTAPYLLYSYVRTRSIFRKLEEGEAENLSAENLALSEPAEIHLARTLDNYGKQVLVVLDDFRPNLLATYLLELARAFHSFFEACPVLKSEGITRESRLILCDLTSRVLKDGLQLLSIEVPERM